MVVNVDRVLAREEYASLSYNTRCWLRFRTEGVAAMMLVVGVIAGHFVIP